MDTTVIDKLNEFLEGNYMAIHAYERYIQNVEDLDLKETFQKIQQDHKMHASIVSERIQDLGGVPADDAGLKGKIAQMATKIKKPATDSNFILKDAIVGENRGIDFSKNLVKGDLDSDSLKLVKGILNHDKKHVELLNTLLH